MDIITLALAKKYANKVAAGFSSVSVEDNKIIFTLNDGKTAEMTVPTPADGKDGISITNVEIDDENNLLCTLSNGETINAGKLPIGSSDNGSLEQVQSDWNQNDETAPDYVKNRFGGYDITEPIVVIDEKTITLTQSESNINGNYEYDYYYNLSQEEIALYNEYFGGPNKTAEIIINGEKHIVNGFFSVDTLNSTFKVRTDKYYFFTEMLNNRLLFCFNNIDDVFTEATIKICSIGNSTPVKIDEKYLPDTMATKAYVDEKFNSIVNGDEVSY